MAGPVKEDDELITAINVTPLVDIVLVLLIVLMVTSSYLVNKAISVELPKAATGETTTPTMSISLDVEGKVYLDGTAIDTPGLQSRIREAYKKDPDVKAIISADGRVKHMEVVSIIDLLRREKVTKFAINTSPIEDAKSK
jgi:biopolymer transport protein ExbD